MPFICCIVAVKRHLGPQNDAEMTKNHHVKPDDMMAKWIKNVGSYGVTAMK